jgi:hypothetical protein
MLQTLRDRKRGLIRAQPVRQCPNAADFDAYRRHPRPHANSVPSGEALGRQPA